MTRTIKRVTHDLLPLSSVGSELTSIIITLLKNIEPHLSFNTPKSAEYFRECIEASQNIENTSKLIMQYLKALDIEADEAGILKD